MPYANLLKSLQALIAAPMSEQSPAFLGESVDDVKSGVHVVLSNLLGIVVHQGTTTSEGATLLRSVLNSPAVDAYLPTENLNERFTGGMATHSLMCSGTALLSELLGLKLAAVVDTAASMSGMRRKSSAALLAMAAPFVLGFLKRELIPNGGWVGALQLTDLLEAQKHHLRGHISERFFASLGLGSVTAWLGVKEARTNEAMRRPVQEGNTYGDYSVKQWLPWLLAAGALILLGIYGCGAIV